MGTVGILGGGQLARMLVLAGAPLGVRFLVVDGAEDACAGHVSPLLRADWRDFDTLEKFARQVDVATFDFENVPAETAQGLTQRTQVFPNPRALETAQDRLAEKTLFRECGLDTPEFAPVDTRADLDAALREVAAPAILKTRRLGYDGKGQFRLRSIADADAAWQALGAQASAHGLILEAFVPFECEVSVIAVRGRDGDFRTWPLTRNWHSDGILAASLAPANIDPPLQARAFELARIIAEKLDYVGVFALELFVHQGKLLGNEMAPRVHNSGHWTIEGALTSQFENHVRAVLGLPLGDTAVLGRSCMLNWIGELPDASAILRESDAHWHDYGKSPRAGRKVGHATLRARDGASLAATLQRVGAGLRREQQVTPVIEALSER